MSLPGKEKIKGDPLPGVQGSHAVYTRMYRARPLLRTEKRSPKGYRLIANTAILGTSHVVSVAK